MKLFRYSLFILLLAVCSCEKTVINRGYIIEGVDFSKIAIGKSDARFVYTTFGSPTIRSSIKDEKDGYSWYYVSKRIEKSGPLDPKIIDQKVVIVTFNKDDVVTTVKESSYEKQIATVSDTTKTEGKTKGIIGETFAGLGKYLKRYTEKDK
jgi:outer membrane protein assembly factor BamE (lipoprotein component of BamABCDE complex)